MSQTLRGAQALAVTRRARTVLAAALVALVDLATMACFVVRVALTVARTALAAALGVFAGMARRVRLAGALARGAC